MPVVVTNTISAGVKLDANLKKAQVEASAQGFYSRQVSGADAGQNSLGVKIAVDATYVSKKNVIVNNPAVQVSTQNQTRVGGSISWFYQW